MVSGFQMKETQDDSKGDTVSRTSSFSSKSLVLDIDKFKVQLHVMHNCDCALLSLFC